MTEQPPGPPPTGEQPTWRQTTGQQGWPHQEWPQQPGYASPPPPPQGTSGLAIASLVLGLVGLILSWFAFGLPSLLALIFGIIAIRQTGAGLGKRAGRGMAIAGTVLGAVIVGLGIWVSAVFVYAVGQAANEASKAINAPASASPNPPPDSSLPTTEETTPSAEETPVRASLGTPLTVTSADGTEEATLTAASVKVRTTPGVDFGERPKNGYFLLFTINAAATGDFDLNETDFYITVHGAHIDPGEGNSVYATDRDTLSVVTLHAGEKTSALLVFDSPAGHGELMYAPNFQSGPIGSWTF